MKPVDLKELTDDELQKAFKSVKVNYISFCIAYALLLGVAIFKTFRKEGESGVTVFIFIPIAFLPIMMNVSKKYKAIRQEIKLREL